MQKTDLTRRSFLKGLGAGAAGLTLAGAMTAFPAMAGAPEVPEWPWTWHPIDKQKALEYTYKRWYEVGGCGGGAVAGIMELLAEEYGYPVLSVDRPYAVRSSGQLRTRIQAFVERVEMKKISAKKQEGRIS